MRGQHVVAADGLDVEELVFRSHLAYGDQLDAVLLAVGRIEEQVSEIARPLAFLERRAYRINVLLLLSGVAHVQDEAGVTAVVVVAAPGQGGRLVELGRLQRAEILGQAVAS